MSMDHPGGVRDRHLVLARSAEKTLKPREHLRFT